MKKLVLSQESLGTLSDEELAKVVGGDTGDKCSGNHWITAYCKAVQPRAAQVPQRTAPAPVHAMAVQRARPVAPQHPPVGVLVRR